MLSEGVYNPVARGAPRQAKLRAGHVGTEEQNRTCVDAMRKSWPSSFVGLRPFRWIDCPSLKTNVLPFRRAAAGRVSFGFGARPRAWKRAKRSFGRARRQGRAALEAATSANGEPRRCSSARWTRRRPCLSCEGRCPIPTSKVRCRAKAAIRLRASARSRGDSVAQRCRR